MLKYEVMMMNGLWRFKERTKEAVHNFFVNEEGDTNFISIIVILVIVMGLAVVFRKNIAELVNNIWKSIFTEAGSATGGSTGSADEFH